MDVRKLIERFAAAEEAALRADFLAPVVRGGRVCVRIEGVVCEFYPEDRSFEGWGVFHPISMQRARLVRPGEKALVRSYLDRLVPVELILAGDSGSTRPAVIAHPRGSRVQVEGLVQVHLVERAEQFRHIDARFDGFHFWFERVRPGRNPAVAAYLRRSLAHAAGAETLRHAGLTPAERSLYSTLVDRELLQREDSQRRQIRTALEHAGAALTDYRPEKGECNVSFILDGERHTSRVRTSDLTVLSAGICLDGEDEKFDLQSLMGVLREARRNCDDR